MKRSFLAAFIWLCIIRIAALVCIPADGSLQLPQSRDFHFHYHTGHTDYYFYGSNKWAVRFDFKNAYPGLANVIFKVQGARLYFPHISDEVYIELYSDDDGLLGGLLDSATASINQNLIDVFFAENHALEKAWLIVEYTTNMANRWVAASAGAGENSYFMNQVGDTQSLIPFASAGYSAELLFGLLGDFQLSEPDLQLLSFELEGERLPGRRLSPAFSIYNHSSQAIAEASLNLMFSKPDSAAFMSLNIPVQQQIPPHSEIHFDSSHSWMPRVELPDEACEIRVEALLQSELTENDTLFVNNRKSQSYQIFSDENPISLVENFLRFDETQVISIIQEGLLSPIHHPLFYYPMLTDSLSNLPSHRRFNWYQLAFIPSTIAMGKARVIGFRQDYEDDFAQILAQSAHYRSFISHAECDISQPDISESISLNLRLKNENTLLYASQSQNLVANSRLFVALCQKHDIAGFERQVLERFIAFADTISAPLNRGDEITKNYQFTLSGVSNAQLIENYRIYYWLQENKDAQIYYVNYRDFSPADFTANQDEHLPKPRLKIWPNPLLSGDKIYFSSEKPGRLSVYNLRGQLLHQQEHHTPLTSLNSEIFGHSGIYLVRFKDYSGQTQNRKISILK